MKSNLEVMAPDASPAGISIEQAFRAAASKALDKDSLQVMRELLAMDAERKFNSAFVRLQREIPVIVASSVIPNRGKYERFEDVMDKISGPLNNNGFSVSFAQQYEGNLITVTCTLIHEGGHSRSNPYAVRVGGKADSETQADCKASTTAKRNALCQALNIVIRQDCLNDDDDARHIGNLSEKITAAQAEELERRVAETNSNVSAFLRFAGADKFANIPASRYDQCDSTLRQKERR